MASPLFDYRAVGLATFLGTPLAGSVLMAVNYWRLRNSAAAVSILLVGAAGAGLEIWIALGPQPLPLKFLPLALLFATMGLAKILQGAMVERHVREGGRLASGWMAAATGIVSGLLVFFLAWALAAMR